MTKITERIDTFYKSAKMKVEDFIFLTLNRLIEILNPKTFKRLIFLFFCIFIFFIFQNQINLFVEENILVKPDFSNALLDSVFVLAFIITIIFVLIKTIKHRYVPSYNDIFITSSTVVVLSYYDFLQKWNPLKINLFFFKLEYVLLIAIPIMLYLGIIVFNYLYPKFNRQVPEKIKNIFINDSPLANKEEDKLDTSKVANNLIQILINEKHETCFSIGLVGPWGNGKSSIFKMVYNNLSQKQYHRKNNNDIIIVNFFPSLNHKEDDIINEFFIILSNELSKFNGKLSSQLMLYSQKITNLYKDKNIFNFLENHITKIDTTSACELYHEINDRLIEINKKIIVLVDDLDRLNEKEILQVLKLIRNTANFKNTIFVVAMDKEYVLNRLKSDKDILNTRFIDKFFQLEIYLPEIDNSALRNYFFDCLKESILSSSSDFENQLTDAMSSGDNLFNDYVKNIRDVKRIVNQIVYDYPIFKKEIDLKDFMNFTYFKLKFPKYLRLLNDRRADFIYVDTSKSTYNLIKKNDTDDDIFSNKKKLLDLDFLEKYEIFTSKDSINCDNLDMSVNCEDKPLLLKTLAYLFGEENNVPDINSIKHENNFRMLMQQKIFENYFSQTEFEKLYDEDLNEQLLTSIFLSNKLPQLINRFNFFNTTDSNKIKKTVEILILLYNKRFYYRLFEPEILLLIENFVQRYFENDKRNKHEFSNWLIVNIFDNNSLLKETRIYLLGHVWNSRIENKLWNISKEYITRKVQELFKEYLDDYSNNLWDINDYSVYRTYNSISLIKDINASINSIFINFWSKNHIELLCAQVIELDPFTRRNLRITNTIDEIFSNKATFIEFVKKHTDHTLSQIKEFITFFDLAEITRHSEYIVFEFKESELMKSKIKTILDNPTRNKFESLDNASQIFFVCNNIHISNAIFNNSSLNKNYNFKIMISGDQYYIISTMNRKIKKEDIISIAQEILNIAYVSSEDIMSKLNEKILFEKKNFIPLNSNKYTAQLFSFQPNIEL